jgi:Flp pilus assembly protein TadD
MLLLGTVLALGGVLITRQRIGAKRSTSKSQVSQSTPAPTFVGASKCGVCHQSEFQRWIGSHHQLAMQSASDATVLGNFNGARFSNQGLTSIFFRSGGKFMVHTDGPDGILHDYEIQYTFGVSPLQQYLIRMPGGRLQVLGIAWDSRSRVHGGQRWFFLYPGTRITYRDPLHWTGIDQNWNFMCADCHSTNVRKNYDSPTRTYATSYAEIDVACEACHGPGSNHIAWAKKQGSWRGFATDQGLLIALNERRNVVWTIDPATGNAHRSEPRASEQEIQMCARCHSRRAQIHEDYVHGQPAGDDYRVSLLDDDLYYPDGQIKGEVYEYGSFVQSKMFHEGVTCSDCHEPHSLKLRAEGNRVCFQCHAPRKYDSPEHHFHQAGSPGAACVYCHMPSRTYMVVDPRRDHSIRIPRPDLSVNLGTPNACNGCHTDKSPEWALETVRKWYGRTPRGFQEFAETLNVGSLGAPGAAQKLADLIADQTQPAIARGTALETAATYAGFLTDAAINKVISDPSPSVRRAAARSLPGIDPQAAVLLTVPLLSDPVRIVRIEAAESFAGTPDNAFSAGTAATFARALDEYIAAQELDADRPEAHLNLGLLFAKEQQPGKAEKQLETALSLDPSFALAAVNLADLYRALGRETDAERVLRDSILRNPGEASIEYALGLAMVRQRHKQEALSHLAAAAKLAPADARFGYVYALALSDVGQPNQATDELERVLKLHPYDINSLATAADLYEKAGHLKQALSYARRLAEITPNDVHAQDLVQRIRNQMRQ